MTKNKLRNFKFIWKKWNRTNALPGGISFSWAVAYFRCTHSRHPSVCNGQAWSCAKLQGQMSRVNRSSTFHHRGRCGSVASFTFFIFRVVRLALLTSCRFTWLWLFTAHAGATDGYKKTFASLWKTCGRMRFKVVGPVQGCRFSSLVPCPPSTIHTYMHAYIHAVYYQRTPPMRVSARAAPKSKSTIRRT